MYFCIILILLIELVDCSKIIKLKECSSMKNVIKVGKSCFLVVDELAASANAEYIEEDQPIFATEPWGLNRMDQANLPLSKTIDFDPQYKGSGVHVYVIDTGIRDSHREFALFDWNGTKVGSRATFAANFIDNLQADSEGHGTHVSGTIGGSTCGVAKNASIFGVKVLGLGGAGTTSSVIQGLQWALAHAGGKSSVISLSLGGGKSKILNDAVQASSDEGHIVVVAAGNSNKNACLFSPGSSGGTARKTYGPITVAASEINDHRASYSNYGLCVDMFAPGTFIYSSFKDSDNSYRILSGTSMAVPHISGAAAILLEKYKGNKTAAMVELFSTAVKNKIKNCKTSPNVLIQVQSTKNRTHSPTFPPTTLFGICVNQTCTSLFEESLYGPKLDRTRLQIYPIVYDETMLCNPSRLNRYYNKIVVTPRGKCDFAIKSWVAQTNGALGLIVHMTNVNELPIAMSAGNNNLPITIPTTMVSLTFGQILKKGSRVSYGLYNTGNFTDITV